MKIKVSLFATLRPYAPKGHGNAFELALNAGSTAGAVFESLEIPASVETVILVNGRHADRETRLVAGDTVTLYPTIAGG